MANGDVRPALRRVLQVFRGPVVHRQLAVLSQQQDARGRELLGQRSNLENGLRPDRHVQLDVGQAIGADADTLAVADDVQSQSWNVMLFHLRVQVFVHSICERAGQRGDESDERETDGNDSTHGGNTIRIYNGRDPSRLSTFEAAAMQV